MNSNVKLFFKNFFKFLGSYLHDENVIDKFYSNFKTKNNCV